jgi:hypothetical protein
MAFWYVQKPRTSGGVYGNEDKWNGLAVIFDTYDNDRKKYDLLFTSPVILLVIVPVLSNNPYILVWSLFSQSSSSSY